MMLFVIQACSDAGADAEQDTTQNEYDNDGTEDDDRDNDSESDDPDESENDEDESEKPEESDDEDKESSDGDDENDENSDGDNESSNGNDDDESDNNDDDDVEDDNNEEDEQDVDNNNDTEEDDDDDTDNEDDTENSNDDDNSDTEDNTGNDSEQNDDSDFQISNLRIEPNPNSVVSVYVSWETNKAADSEVQFGEGDYQFKIYDDEAVTEHRVLVIGMHAQTDYLIKAISISGDDSAEVEDSYTTEALPSFIPEGTIITDDPRSQPGWTLINLLVGADIEIPASDYPCVAIMYDHDGRVVWYREHGTNPDIGGAISMDFFPESNTVLMGPTDAEPPREVDLAGDIIWEGPPAEGVDDEGMLTHHVDKLSNGNYLLLRWVETREVSDDPFQQSEGLSTTHLEEVTPNNELVWSWDLFDHLTIPDDATGDWCHGNSAIVDIEKDEVYLSCRWLGLFKTTYNNPQAMWHMQATAKAAEMGDFTFEPPESQFTDIHDPEIHEDGTILFFDNGGWSEDMFFNPDADYDYHSRVLEYEVDENAKVARKVWEFPGDFPNLDSWFFTDYYQPFWGDADRLDNGNILITDGVVGPGTTSHLFEVDRDSGDIVWDFTLPENNGFYRAQRIPTPPLIEPL